jgi:hypothetical protein
MKKKKLRKQMAERTCACGCGKKFIPTSGIQKYADDICAERVAYNKKVKVKQMGDVLLCELPWCRKPIMKKWSIRYCCPEHQEFAKEIERTYGIKSGNEKTKLSILDRIKKRYKESEK